MWNDKVTDQVADHAEAHREDMEYKAQCSGV